MVIGSRGVQFGLKSVITRIITDRIGRQEGLIQINHNPKQFPKKQKHVEQISPLATIPFVENSAILEMP